MTEEKNERKGAWNSRQGQSRRDVLKAGLAGFAMAIGGLPPGLDFITDIENPLRYYPSRDWEDLYRDLYRYDDTFTFVCAPNDTHNCRLRGYKRNGVLVRIEQAYDVADYTDLQGNETTATWHPRGCLKGYTYMRRVYNKNRIKHPVVRRGWKQWVEAGFPRDEETGRAPEKYFRRGEDEWVRVSWDEIFNLVARALKNVGESYSGEQGERWLMQQGYQPEQLGPMRDPDGEIAGTRTMKFRGGMAFLGVTRLAGAYRLSNMMALLDHHLRDVDPDRCMGGRNWDNYAYHTDLPPGHPMVHGAQTFDQEFHDYWNSDMIVISGLNLVENKMADAPWWHSAIDRDKKIVVIAPEYSPTVTKSDYWLPVRPGTDTALMLGVAGVLIGENLYEHDFTRKFTNLPYLIREDTLKPLKANDLEGGPMLDPGETYTYEDGTPIQKDADELGFDGAIALKNDDTIAGVTRNCLGEHLEKQLSEHNYSLEDLALDYAGTVQTKDGPVKVKSVFRLYKELTDYYTPERVEEITGAPADKVRMLARDAADSEATAWLCGMGMNMYLHNDLINRSYYLVACLTGDVGKPGGNVGSYAGNYKSPVFNGLPAYVAEDPFNQTLDSQVDGQDVRKRGYTMGESVHFWIHEDKPLVLDTPEKGRVVLTEEGHMPSPSKVVWTCNANQIGNAKWHYNLIKNVLPKQEMLVAMDYQWNMNCEYSDVVFPVDSWVEFEHPDMTCSCTNPFLQVFPRRGIDRLYNTRHDIEVWAGVSNALADLTGDERFSNYFKFVNEDDVEVYMQRILDASDVFRGYDIRQIMEDGGAALAMFRTYPRIPGWEQIQESKPFYTKTGRLELYRDEEEWLNQGEGLIVHREPVEATPYQPNVIVVPEDFPAIRPLDYGISPDELDSDLRCIFNQKWSWERVRDSQNPLTTEYGLFAVFVTCKGRHQVHTSWRACDWNLVWASNFGDPEHRDKRSPWVGEAELDINPEEAKELGIKDGDYVYLDSHPLDRPYAGRKGEDPFYDEMSRLLVRAKHNPSYPRGMLNIKHSLHGTTHSSLRAQQQNPEGTAINSRGYIPTVRAGSQQSCVRSWLNPTQMTGSLVHKDYFTHRLVKGYTIDIHTPTGAPKESLVKVTPAEDGGLGGKGTWEPASTGFSPGDENADMKRFLGGRFVKITKPED